MLVVCYVSCMLCYVIKPVSIMFYIYLDACFSWLRQILLIHHVIELGGFFSALKQMQDMFRNRISTNQVHYVCA